MKWCGVVVAAAALCAGPMRAQGAVAPSVVASGPDLEVPAGAVPARTFRPVVWTSAPAQAGVAWARFQQEAGASWQVYWDADTGVPGRIFGAGVPAPGSVADASTAEAFARELLARHLDLLAPGSQASDFVLAANDLSGDLRTVGFLQMHQGALVDGGQVSFRFKNDRLFVIGSEALPNVALPALAPAAVVAPARAQQLAAGWITSDFGVVPTTVAPTPAVILPIVRGPGAIEYRRVLTVTADAPEVPGRWDIYVDAATGSPVARRQLLFFATGTALYNVPVRWWAGLEGRVDMPAPRANLTVNGATVTSGDNGTF